MLFNNAISIMNLRTGCIFAIGFKKLEAQKPSNLSLWASQRFSECLFQSWLFTKKNLKLPWFVLSHKFATTLWPQVPPLTGNFPSCFLVQINKWENFIHSCFCSKPCGNSQNRYGLPLILNSLSYFPARGGHIVLEKQFLVNSNPGSWMETDVVSEMKDSD